MSKKIIYFILLFCISILVNAQEIGNASFYSKKLNGRRMSDGSRYHSDSLTCAHRTLPFGSLVRVRNINNNLIVTVKVTDRGPHIKNRIIDLSYKAASEIDIIRKGIAKVEINCIVLLPQIINIIPTQKVFIKVDSIVKIKNQIW